jgi:molybdopterin-containing oxidoreductase family iron-sulfur binding subunit
MEKCTYCVQRINAARVETKLHDLSFIPDGYLQTACQQACPSNAIVFGDIFDNDSNDGAGSRVKQLRNDNRAYALLSFINTRPRTSHLLRIRNPNPKLRKPIEDPFHAHGDHGHDHGGGDHDHSHEPKGEGHVMSLPVLNIRSGVLA